MIDDEKKGKRYKEGRKAPNGYYSPQVSSCIPHEFVNEYNGGQWDGTVLCVFSCWSSIASSFIGNYTFVQYKHRTCPSH